MASPVVESSAGADATNTDTLTITAPSGIVEGELLVAFIDFFDDVTQRNLTGDTISATGWKMHVDVHPVTYAIDAVLYKRATAADESASDYDFVLSGAAVDGVGGGILRISPVGAYPAIIPTPANGSTSNPNPPASGTVPSGDYLALCSAHDNNLTQTPPTNYTEEVDATSDYTAIASRELTGITSEDPGTFGTSSGFWSAFTVLVGVPGLSLVCGAECQIHSVGSGAAADSHWSSRSAGNSSTPEASAAQARSGSYSLYFSSATSGGLSYLRHTASTFKNVGYFRGYFRLPDVTPTNETAICWMGDISWAFNLVVTTGGTLRIKAANTTYSSTNDLSLSVDTWYGVEVESDADGEQVKWRVHDGTAWSTSETVSDASTDQVQQTVIGIATDAGEADWEVYWDDIAIGYPTVAGTFYDDTGTNGVSGKVLRYSPTSDGTHSFDTTGDFTKSGTNMAPTDTDAYANLDAADMEQTAEYISIFSALVSEYVEVNFADESTETLPRGVSVVGQLDFSWAGEGVTVDVDVSDDGFTSSVTALTGADAGVSQRHLLSTCLATAPSGAAWSAATVNSMEARISADSGSGEHVNSLALEVEWTGDFRPRFETAATGTNSSSSTLTINKPSGTVSGDVLVASVAWSDGITPGAWSSSGWTLVAQHDYNLSVDHSYASFYKVAGGSEPSSYTFSQTASGAELAGGIIRISGAASVIAATASATGSNSNPDPPASGTVASGNYLAVVTASGNNSTQTPPTNYTERVDVAGGAPTAAAASIATRELTGITSENPGTFGVSVVYEWLSTTIMVAAATAATLTLHAISPTDDVTTTGWSSTPLWSKIDDDPDSPDGTVIAGAAS